MPTPPSPSPSLAATLRDLEGCLVRFQAHVAHDRRMEFWRRSDAGSGEHVWRAGPEAFAKSLLWAFLEGTFRGELEILEEVLAGAGRIDLYVRLRGGERVVIELKMLGSGYSSTYAADGFAQLCHYLDSKGTRIGYLIAFDAHARDQGPLQPAAEAGARQISVLHVDVRPTVRA